MLLVWFDWLKVLSKLDALAMLEVMWPASVGSAGSRDIHIQYSVSPSSKSTLFTWNKMPDRGKGDRKMQFEEKRKFERCTAIPTFQLIHVELADNFSET